MELERLLAALRRRWYIVAALVVFGAALGLLGESGRTNRYIAQASVEVASDRNVYGSDQVLQRIVVNEMDFITSLDLRLSVVNAVDVVNIDPRADMTVAQRTDTDIVDLRVEAPEENAAIAAVNFWAESWLARANARKTEALDASIVDETTRLEAAQAELATIDADIDDLLGSGDREGTIDELFFANPTLAAEQRRLTAEVRNVASSIVDLRSQRSKISPFSIASRATAPATDLRSGNGLGPSQGMVIGFGLALAFIVALDRSKVTIGSARQITPSFWAHASGRDSHKTERLAQELFRTFSDDRLHLVGFSSSDQGSFHDLQLELATYFAERDFDVTILTDDSDLPRSHSSRIVTLPRNRVSDVIDLATRNLSDLRQSIVFADLTDLWFQRSLVDESALVALVHLEIGDDSEATVARTVSQARALTPAVLAVAA